MMKFLNWMMIASHRKFLAFLATFSALMMNARFFHNTDATQMAMITFATGYIAQSTWKELQKHKKEAGDDPKPAPQ